jgi:hypothetical protein
VISTRRRRDNPLAQRLTTAATRELYRKEDSQRPDHSPGRIEKAELGSPKTSATITQVHQGVGGHNVAIVLGVSLFLAAVGALAFSTTLSFQPTSLGRHPSPMRLKTVDIDVSECLRLPLYSVDECRLRQRRFASLVAPNSTAAARGGD